eukprot:5645442-Alexandrium_andersonii.AAC.1
MPYFLPRPPLAGALLAYSGPRPCSSLRCGGVPSCLSLGSNIGRWHIPPFNKPFRRAPEAPVGGSAWDRP